jgi:hypothetical protein
MRFFYSSGAMGYHGEGWKWHKLFGYKFPDFPVITKTITMQPKKGLPFAIIPFGKSVWNKNMLSNMGFHAWKNTWDRIWHENKSLIVSLSGTDREIQTMCNGLHRCNNINGIELNYSCPNVKTLNCTIPKTDLPIYLKLNHTQNPMIYRKWFHRIKRIHVNSIPKFGGGVSGKMAQKDNWYFIEKILRTGIMPMVAGCSFYDRDDINMLNNMGCNYIGIGSTLITNPRFIEILKDYPTPAEFDKIYWSRRSCS